MEQKSPDDFPAGDLRKGLPRFDSQHFPDVLELVDTLAAIGKESHNGATAGQITIAWLLTLSDNIIPLPGSRSVKYAEENLYSVEIKLSTGDIERINKALEKTDATVAKALSKPEHAKATSFRETPALQE